MKTSRRNFLRMTPAAAAGAAALSLAPGAEAAVEPWSGRRIRVSMEVMRTRNQYGPGGLEQLQAYPENSEALDQSLADMRRMLSDYINHGTKE